MPWIVGSLDRKVVLHKSICRTDKYIKPSYLILHSSAGVDILQVLLYGRTHLLHMSEQNQLRDSWKV